LQPGSRLRCGNRFCGTQRDRCLDQPADVARVRSAVQPTDGGPCREQASNCVKAGLVYSDHCLQAFAAGDTSLAAYARAVDQMLGLCGTLSKLASLSSSYLPEMAKVALIGCQDCETECRKHAERHAPCKACAEACHLRGGVQEAGRLIIGEMWFRSALNREARCGSYARERRSQSSAG
jgi:Cys-rich four helix bundle protein (predicted Tat secretion target)